MRLAWMQQLEQQVQLGRQVRLEQQVRLGLLQKQSRGKIQFLYHLELKMYLLQHCQGMIQFLHQLELMMLLYSCCQGSYRKQLVLQAQQGLQELQALVRKLALVLRRF